MSAENQQKTYAIEGNIKLSEGLPYIRLFKRHVFSANSSLKSCI